MRKEMIFVAFIAVFASVICYANWNSPGPLLYAYTRPDLIEQLTGVIRQGLIPDFLSKIEHSWGFTFYLPYIAYFLGVKDFYKFLLAIHMAATWILLVVFPLEIKHVTKNIYAAYLSPILLHIFVGDALYGYKTETLWSGGYTLIIAIPLIYYYFYTKDSGKRLKIIIFLGLLCSIANVLRNENSFSTIIFLFIVMVITSIKDIHADIRSGDRNIIKSRIIFLLAVLVLLYILYYSVCTLVPWAVGRILGLKVIDNAGFVWHTVLCGLIKWDDGYILSLIAEEYGIEPQYSNYYLQCCRDYFFKLLASDPGAVIFRYWHKFLHCWDNALSGLFLGYLYGDKNSASWVNVHIINIPTIISAVISLYVYIRNRSKISLKKWMPWFLLWIIVTSAGMAQGVLATGDLRYYIPGIVGISATPMLILLVLLCETTKG